MRYSPNALRLKIFCAAFASLATIGSSVVASATTVHKKSHSAVNTTKGQAQLSGGNGQFGTIYSFKGGFNMEILGAKYSVDPVVSYLGYTHPDPTQKMLIVNIAVKNATSSNQNLGSIPNINVFDQNAQQYQQNAFQLQSMGEKQSTISTMPGQGFGLPSQHNPLTYIYLLPNDARIMKMVVSPGRLNHASEDVFRYYIAGATVAEDGGAGDPVNAITPLPANLRDPSDPTGATALAAGKGGKPGDGTICPSDAYDITLDSFGDAPPDVTDGGAAPKSGNRFVIATLTATNVIADPKAASAICADGGKDYLQDADGDNLSADDLIKATTSSTVYDTTTQPGQVYHCRLLFEAPIGEKFTTLHIAAGGGRFWDFDVSGS